MENKYYTPDISELHIGMEIERATPSTETADGMFWTPYKVDDSTPMTLFKQFPEFQRIKYLSKKDIENEGWIYSGGQMIKGGKCYFTNKFQQVGITFRPEFYKEDKHASIHIYNINVEGGIKNSLFIGKVKNVSEFKKLMNQIDF